MTEPMQDLAQLQLDALEGETVLASDISFADYLKQFDGVASEWVYGKVIQLSNNRRHNQLLRFLITFFDVFFGFKNNAEVLPAGAPMYISGLQPARQPDLIIVLNENAHRIEANRLNGPADIAVEIISPESGLRDRGVKFCEYALAGVREYWLIDPGHNEAIVYVLDDRSRYHRREREADGKLTSSLLPSLALDAALLWQKPLPNGVQIYQMIEQMLREAK